MAMKIFGVILMLACVGIGWAGYRQAAEQHRKITQFKPAKGTVTAASIAEHVTTRKGRRSVSYSPEVSYRYSVGAGIHTGSTVLPCSQKGSRSWAQSIISRYRVGRECELWYDPADPSESYLMRVYAFTPYLVLLMAIVAGTAGIAMFLLGTSKTPSAPGQTKGGWFQIWPAIGIDQRLRGWGLSAVFGTVMSVLVFGHYFTVASPHETASIVVLVIAMVVFGFFDFMGIRLLMLNRRIRDAIVIIDKVRLACGYSFAVKVGQRMMAELDVPVLRVGLLCIETYRSGKNTATRNVHEQWIPIAENKRAQARDVLEGGCEFFVPPDAPPSTPSKQSGLPRFDWKLRVVTEMKDSPDYSADFPILVLSAAEVPANLQR